jgi:hypothetical protein
MFSILWNIYIRTVISTNRETWILQCVLEFIWSVYLPLLFPVTFALKLIDTLIEFLMVSENILYIMSI